MATALTTDQYDEAERYATAEHEANHLVLIELFMPGLSRGANISPSPHFMPGSLGYASTPSVAARTRDKWHEAMLMDGVCSVGGDCYSIYDLVYEDDPDWWGDVRDDMESARSTLIEAFGEDKLYGALESAANLAARILSWKPVARVRDAVRDTLLERETIIGKDVDEVIGTAYPNRFYAQSSRAKRLVDVECKRLRQEVTQ